ncbi:MAG: cell division protein FtsA [Synergistaceae bacterium]|nr:cell division protein FtsA [Synergistaceae bacterium]
MFRDPDTLVGLGVGTTRITVIVAERDRRAPESAHIIGIGSASSLGIRKGLIVNLEQAVRSVRNALRDAENMVGFQLEEAMVAFNANDVNSVMTSGMVSLRGGPRPVSVNDVERVIEAAQSELTIPGNKVALHTIPVQYSIDGNFGIDDPLGMTGIRLEMELQTITVPMPCIHDVVNCVVKAGIRVEGLVIKPLASALGALTDEEMRVGVISISIGGGTTGLTFYRDGRPIRVSVIPIGGDHITSDLATVLRIPLNRAEELKKKLFSTPEKDLFVVADSRGTPERTIDPNMVLEVIASRLEELFLEYVQAQIPERDPHHFPGGIVLSGGAAKMPGIETLLTDIFKMPVRVASPLDYYQMPPGRNDTSFINATGIIRYILCKERNPYSFIDSPVSHLRLGVRVREPRDVKAPYSQYGSDRPVKTGSGGQSVKNVLEKIKESLKELFL